MSETVLSFLAINLLPRVLAPSQDKVIGTEWKLVQP